jgi:hypothetical protein
MLAVTTLAVAVKAKRRAKVGLMLRMCILIKGLFVGECGGSR